MKDSRKGNISVIGLGVALLLIMFMFIFVEMACIYENSEYAKDVLQRACNSSVQMSILDEYRQDRILKMDTEKAENLFYEYIQQDSDARFTVNVSQINSSDTPPRLTVCGSFSFPTVFSCFGFEDFTRNFEVTSTAIDLE